MTEAVLQRLILGRLQHAGIFAWRANTGAAQRGDQVIRFGHRGQSDILGALPPAGRMLAIEVKSETGRQRPDQQLFGERVRAMGGLYVLARSLDDVSREIGINL